MIVKSELDFPIETIRLATQPYQDGNGNWINKIIDIGFLNRNIAEDKFFQVSGLEIVIDDSDRYFRDMMESDVNKFISGRSVKLLQTDDTVIYEGVVSNWGYRKELFVLEISDRLSGIEEQLTDTIQATEYDDTVSDAIGIDIPIIYGELTDTLGAVKCWKTDSNSYLVSAHHCKSIDNVFESDIEIDSGSWSIDNNVDGKCYIIYAGGTADYITANVKGSIDGGSNLITEPVEALRDLIDNYTNFSYDTTLFNASETIMQTRRYIINSMITDETFEQYLSVFCLTFSSDFWITENNEIAIGTTDNFNITSVASFNENNILEDSFSTPEDPNEIKNKIKYMYHYNYIGDYYNKLPVEDRPTDWGVFYDTLPLKATNDDVTALDAVNRLLYNKANPKREEVFSLGLADGINLKLFNYISVTHPDAISESAEIYQIRQINNIDLIGDSLGLRCTKVPILTNGFILGDRTILPQFWNAATGSERDYGYLCDRADGYFSNDVDPGKVLT